MSVATTVLFGVLFAVGYLVTPVMLVSGWMRWVKSRSLGTAAAVLSFTAFVLGTVSATLACSTTAYAQVHHFGFYDPTLMRIEGWGMILSLVSILLALIGLSGKSAVRWHAPVCAVGTLVFWVMAAAGE